MNKATQHTTQYKNSPLGLIPDDWEVKEINQIGVNVIDGDRGKNYPSENEFTSSGYCVFLNAKNVTNQGFAFIDINFITEEKDKELRKGKLIKQDIVLTTRGTVGNISFFDESVQYENLRINSGMVLIRNTKTELIENNFLYKCFTSYVLQQQIDKVSFGSAQPQLTVKEINKFKLPIPTLPEQKAIADCLSTWDKAIEKQIALITQKELSKKALMQQLLSGKKRLKGFRGEWRKFTLNDVANFINGKAYKQEELLNEGKYKVLRVGNFFSNSNWYYSDLELDNDKYVNDGDLMYAWSASFGPRFWVGEKTIYHYHIWKVIPLELIVKDFLYYFFVFDTEMIFSNKQGGTMFHVTKGDMEKRKIKLPSLEEQTAIANVLQCADTEIQLLQNKLAQLKEQKKGLMQVLLTGKKRLKY